MRAAVKRNSAMSQDDTVPVSIIALRADGYSADGKNVIISLKTKFSTAERKYSVPLECFYDLIVDLQRLNASKEATSIEPSTQPTSTPSPSE
jgi:hypothetical protein